MWHGVSGFAVFSVCDMAPVGVAWCQWVRLGLVCVAWPECVWHGIIGVAKPKWVWHVLSEFGMS